MFNDLLKQFGVPMFGIVGDEDNGGSDDTPKDPPAEPEVTDDKGNPPPPPAENNEEVADESEISDDDYNATMEKMSPRQLAAMNKRMRDKMAKIEAERKNPPAPIKKEEEVKPPVNQGEQKPFEPVEWISDTEFGRKVSSELMEETGMSKKALTNFMHIMGIMADRIARSRADGAVEPLASEFQEGKLKKSMDSVSGEDDFKFAMSKTDFKKEVEDLVRKDYSPKEWGNPDTIKKAFKDVFFNRRQEFASSGKREIVEDGSIHEKSVGSGQAQGGGGVSATELKEYADSYNLDLSDPKVKKAAIDGVLAKRKAEKRIE